MSQWGVFYVGDGENEVETHVAPVLPDGRLHINHSLHEFCPCGPKRETGQSPAVIWVHQDKERGGSNA